jgi:hypothetical protein
MMKKKALACEARARLEGDNTQATHTVTGILAQGLAEYLTLPSELEEQCDLFCRLAADRRLSHSEYRALVLKLLAPKNGGER